MNPLIVIILLLLSTNLFAQDYVDVDLDNDGLIEVNDLETLNAMRYQLDGSGLQLDETAVEITTGCAPGGCKGYELTRDLDFKSADSYQNIANLNRWTDGAGWQPIGDATHPFTAIFKTNNGSTPNVIYNLMINRPGENSVGLFGHIGSSAKISGIGLLNTEITGHSQVGGLVGKSASGDISNSYVSGRVVGKGVEIGLLSGSSSGLITNSYANGEVVGEGNGVGGLVGASSGSITNSYAMGSVVGTANHVGGLVGNNSQGTISNCYTTGSVSGSEDIGGLVGISNLGKLVGNYVSGKTSGKRYIGGLVGINVGGTITRSYWDKTTNKLQQNTGGVGLSASKLQSQNAQDDDSNKPYYKWSTANWDFGTAEQYPILKYATGSDPDNPACGPGQTLPNCGTLLLGQHASLERIMFSEQVELSPTFKPTELNYQLNISPQITQLQLTPIASNPASTIRISSNGIVVNTSSSMITLGKNTSITIEVSAPNQRPAQYQFTVHYQQGITILGIPNEIIDEGELIILDAFHSLDVPEDQVSYRWTQTTGKAILSGTDNDRAALFLSIPEDYMPMTEDYAQLGFNIEVTDGKTAFNKNISLVIAKRDNGNIAVGSPSLRFLELTAPEIDLDEDPDGAGKSFAYQWQHRPPGADVEWANIDGATEQTHTISVLTEWYTEYRVLISYTDGQGYQTIATGEAIVYSLKTAFSDFLKGSASEEQPSLENAVPQRAEPGRPSTTTKVFNCDNDDIDDDDDGLIEICYLEDLDAIRYQPDGTGYKSGRSATKITTGCPEEGCKGFELVGDLDFNNDASYRYAQTNKRRWTTGKGWQPIGDYYSSSLRALFNGNGYTISHLMINNRHGIYNMGLFGYTANQSQIINVGLLNVDVVGKLRVGGLVGFNMSDITNSYVTGNIQGSDSSNVGGLVGNHGTGDIRNSYTTANVQGGNSSDVGGLVGYHLDGTITNTYATGKVEGSDSSNVGGLVGYHLGGTITNTYATGKVEGSDSSNVGGLIGIRRVNHLTVVNSYWDTQTSRLNTSANGTSKTTVELQEPEAADGIYANWEPESWHFGTSNQYPVLKYTSNCRNQSNTTSNLPKCHSLLSPIARGLSELQVVGGNLSPRFIVAQPIYRGTVLAVNATEQIKLIPMTLNSTATISIRVNDVPLDSGLSSGIASHSIQLNTSGTTQINIEVDNKGTAPNVQYTLYLSYYPYAGRIIDNDADGLIDINYLEQLYAIRYQLDSVVYSAGSNIQHTMTGCPDTGCRGFELTRDLDFNEDASYHNATTASKALWTMGVGWQPIGDTMSPFTAIFEGNNHTLSNLMINRPLSSQLGLFGVVGNGAKISDIGLLDVSVNGNYDIGGLAGINAGSITNSYTSGEVTYSGAILYGYRSGGLVGNNQETGIIANSYSFAMISGRTYSGGLVGQNYGKIINGYARGNVTARFQVGGLVGINLDGGRVFNSYATGNVNGSLSVGGLVGLNIGGSQIVNSYANTSSIRAGGYYAGGLVGDNNESIIKHSYAVSRHIGANNPDKARGLVGLDVNGEVIASYWDTDTSGKKTSADGTSKTTVELQEPTMPGSISTQVYYNWDTDDWDFGTNKQYPVLKYARSGDENNPTCREREAAITSLPICGDLLSPIARGLEELPIVEGNLSPSFSTVEPIYRGTVVSKTNKVQLIPKALNSDATISITGDNDEAWHGSSGATSSPIQLDTNGITKINIEVNNGSSATTVQYTLYLNYYAYKKDVDSDGDGLIDINNLDQLDAIRYQLDGTSYRESDTSHRITIGCPEGICRGYELMRDLDFDNPAHYQSGSVNTDWTTGLGWQPIGDNSNPFTSTFEGNGYTISNLSINRRAIDIGLFGNTRVNASISNIGLLQVDVMGNRRVGGLAGGNNGKIRNSYTSGMVAGMLSNMGGLVGTNYKGGSITNSYSSCDVSDNGQGTGIHIGGLVGRNRAGIINDSYATGTVSGNAQVGGLVGLNEKGDKISNSYSTGKVLGTSGVGGLVGMNINSIATHSYWDTDTSGIMTSAGGISKTTVELQAPIEPGTTSTDVYYGWSEMNWDFGTPMQYPVLKYARGGRGNRDCRDNSLLRKCKVSLPNLRAVFLTELAISTSTLSPTFSPGILEYDVNVAFNVDEIVLDAEAPDGEPIVVAANTADTISGIRTVNATIPLTITGRTIITITVSDGNQATQYTVTVKHNRFAPGNEDLGKLPEIRPGQINIDEGGEYIPDVRRTSSTSVYQWQRLSPPPKTFAKGPTYRVPENFVEKNQTTRKLNLILAVRNDKGIDIRNDIELTVRKINNGSAQITATLTGTTLTASITQLDSDGMPSESEINYQWQRLDGDGKEVSVSDTHSYKIPQSTTDTTRYRVQISYTDGQDYAETTISNVVIYRNIDQDNDGLIDISTLEQLNAIRYQLDGTGYRESASTMKITAGCPVDGCKGYELIRDLDFTDNGSYRNAPLNKMEWTTSEGWQPIGDRQESFSSIFKGNGHTISNLMINRPTRDFVGLFGMINDAAVIDGIDLYKVNVKGKDHVGALVGKNSGGVIINSSVSGDSSITANKIVGTGEKIGGLVGVNANYDRIKGKVFNSFAVAHVMGETDNNEGYSVGGLIGLNEGIVSNSYAAGDASGREDIGGLVGRHEKRGHIYNSYARIKVITGDNRIGGLVGSNSRSSITSSYWERTSTFTSNNDGVGVSARALKSLPTDTNLYSEWSTEVWDFGTDQQYPTLKYANPQCIEVGGTNYCEDLSEKQEVVKSLCPERDTPDHCGKLTSGQRLGLSSVKLPKNVALLEPFASNKYRYTMLVGNKVEHIPTTPTAISSDAVVTTTTDTSGSITITVAEDNRTLTYTLTKETFDINMDAKTFDEGAAPSSTSLKANLVNPGLNASSISYNWQQQTGKALSSSSVTNEITLTIPKDYVPRDTSTSEIIMMVTATIDIAGKPVSSIARATLMINKINNGTITESLLQPEINENALTLTAPGLLGTDPDGGIDRNTITYQWQSKHSTQAVWATTGTDVVVYMIPKGTLDNTEYRVLISYTDGQGHEERTTSTSITYIDIDRDGDGLIEVSTLEELNAIRYQMDGTGYQETADATLITQGCPTTGCIGYELDTHLDFENNASYSSTLNKMTWTEDAGWDPIGSDDYTAFTSIFNGNYYTISNLTINRPTEDHVGLFGYTSNSTITAIGLWKVNIMAKDNVGGLVGTNQGLINYSDVNGDVNGSKNVGGIAGVNEGSITDSYSNKSDVSGADNIGGIVGSNGSSESTGQITRSYYSSGTITATQSDAAGIAGDNYMGMIKDSYVIVNDVAERITNDNPICRLIGYGNQPIRSTIRTQNNEDCAGN